MQIDAAPSPTPAPRGPAPIPPAIRWLLIVFSPAIGFTAGAYVVFTLVDVQVGLGLGTLCFLGGCLGAAFLLVLGLVAIPWVPGGEKPTTAIGIVPPAPHPDGLSWIGPAAAVLVGLGAGIPIGAGFGSERRYSYGSYLEPFTKASVAILLFGALAAVLFLVHQRHGPTVVPLERPPLHRLVFRCLLRAALGGFLAALAGWCTLLSPDARTPGLEPFLVVLLCGGVLAAFLTAGEAIAWRAPTAWRWPALLACGLVLPFVWVASGSFFDELFRRGNALAALDDMLDDLWRELKHNPGDAVGGGISVAVPFALAGAARMGLLPYFGRRAPWPLVAQLPLGWLAAALGLALSHVLVESVGAHELREGVPIVAAALPALLVGMRLSDPLEARVASRWVLLTGGRD